MKNLRFPLTLWRLATAIYWLALTRALLVTHPWQEFGAHHLAPEPDPSDPVSSFTLHTGAYGLLTWLLMGSLPGTRARARAYWLGAAILHGAVCELLQGLVPNRWPNSVDVLANAVGVAMAYTAFVFAERWLASRRKQTAATPAAEKRKVA